MGRSILLKYMLILPVAITFSACGKYEIDEKKMGGTFAPFQLEQSDIQIDATETGGIAVAAPQFDFTVESLQISKNSNSSIEGSTILKGYLQMIGETAWPIHFALPHGTNPTEIYTDYRILEGGNGLYLSAKCKTKECNVYYLSAIIITVNSLGHFAETRQFVFRKEMGNPQIFIYPVSINNSYHIDDLEVTLDAMATGKL